MLAQSSKIMPVGDDWVYERKLDGLRCVCVRRGDDVKLYSRNRLLFNVRFPLLVAALQELPVDNFILDGEIVAVDESGSTNFGLLQRTKDDSEVQLHLFDVLRLLGNDVRGHMLLERKALLMKFVEAMGPLHPVQHTRGQSDVLLKRACAAGWEGLIAKKANSLYRSGRNPEWLKLKCSASQELVIGGWTEPKGARTGFGALLMGYYDDGELRYAGKVGTGFDSDSLTSLHRSLVALERVTSPFADNPRERNVHWATPELVANIGFGEWTRDGRLRHPRFQGLRPDKAARDVVRET